MDYNNWNRHGIAPLRRALQGELEKLDGLDRDGGSRFLTETLQGLRGDLQAAVTDLAELIAKFPGQYAQELASEERAYMVELAEVQQRKADREQRRKARQESWGVLGGMWSTFVDGRVSPLEREVNDVQGQLQVVQKDQQDFQAQQLAAAADATGSGGDSDTQPAAAGGADAATAKERTTTVDGESDGDDEEEEDDQVTVEEDNTVVAQPLAVPADTAPSPVLSLPASIGGKKKETAPHAQPVSAEGSDTAKGKERTPSTDEGDLVSDGGEGDVFDLERAIRDILHEQILIPTEEELAVSYDNYQDRLGGDIAYQTLLQSMIQVKEEGQEAEIQCLSAQLLDHPLFQEGVRLRIAAMKLREDLRWRAISAMQSRNVLADIGGSPAEMFRLMDKSREVHKRYIVPLRDEEGGRSTPPQEEQVVAAQEGLGQSYIDSGDLLSAFGDKLTSLEGWGDIVGSVSQGVRGVVCSVADTLVHPVAFTERKLKQWNYEDNWTCYRKLCDAESYHLEKVRGTGYLVGEISQAVLLELVLWGAGRIGKAVRGATRTTEVAVEGAEATGAVAGRASGGGVEGGTGMGGTVVTESAVESTVVGGEVVEGFLSSPSRLEQFAAEIVEINKNLGKTGGRGVFLPGQDIRSVLNTASYAATTQERGAVIFKGIIKNHTFGNGNKRTAISALKRFAQQSKIRIRVSDSDLFSIAIQVESGELSNITKISKMLTE